MCGSYKSFLKDSRVTGIFIALPLICLLLLNAPPAVAETYVAGRVSGHWYLIDSPFYVEETIWIDASDTLVIHDNVEVLFLAEDTLIAYGTLITEVPDKGRVIFSEVTGSPKHWAGIYFNGPSSSNSLLQYSKITQVQDGVIVTNSNPRIEYNYIEPLRNGIHSYFANPTIIADTVHVDSTNLLPQIAAGIFLQFCTGRVQIEGCYIDIYVSNDDYPVSAYGVRSINSSVHLSHNILHVAAKNKAIGIYLESSFADTIDHNEVVVSSKSAYSLGALTQYFSNSSLIHNNTFKVQSLFKDFTVTFDDCQVIQLLNNIIVGDGSSVGVATDNPTSVLIRYNDIFNHSTPVQNANLDNTNILVDPLFLFLEPDSVYQLAANSPCIDRGSPDPYYNDPDGTRNDMGAYYHYQPLQQILPPALQPMEYYSLNCFPNPTNNSSMISFTLDSKTFVELKVFDVAGSLRYELIRGFMDSGTYNLPLDLSHCASGVYFVRLSSPQGAEIRKILLLK